MAVINIKCPHCGQSIIGHLGQSIFNDRLVWNLGYGCQCGIEIEEDGYCEMPTEWRQEILRQDGRWGLVIDRLSDEDMIKMLRVLREALELSLPEAGTLRKRIPGVVFSGTRAEMKFLCLKLQYGDIPSSVEKFDETQARNCPEFHCIDQ